MSKFKVGDKVELVANKLRSVNIVGDIGVVTEVSEDVGDSYFKISYRVQVEGKAKAFNWSYESDLVLVTEVKPFSEAKVGDRFRVIDPEFWIQGEGTVVGHGGVSVRFDRYTEYRSESDRHFCLGLWVQALELLPSVAYEDHWRLNDGTEEIPEDADTLEKDGSVVAYRKAKEPEVVTKESRMFVAASGGLSPLCSIFSLGQLKITTTVTDGVLTDVQVEILED